MSVPEEVTAAWSRRSQHLQPHDTHGHKNPLSVLDQVSGVYSSHPTAPLALAARIPGFDLTAYRRLDEERAAIRVPGVRRSKFLLPVPTAATHLSATRLPLNKHFWRLEQADIAVDDYPYWRAAVLAATEAPQTTRSIRKHLVADGHPEVPRGLSAVIATMSYEGVLLRTAPQSMLADQVGYVSTESWLGEPLPEISRATAENELIRGYLRSHGPVGVTDIAWWAGWAQRDVRAVLHRLDAAEIGDGLYLDRVDERRFAEFRSNPQPAAEQLILLPPWDSYMMGYPPGSRQRFVTRDQEHFVYDRSGNSRGVVLRAGRVIACWTLKAADKAAMTATVTPLPDEKVDIDAFAEALLTVESTLETPISPAMKAK